MKILIIEDDKIMLKALSIILSKAGYKVIVASNGKEGFEQINKAKYDMILMDLMMPYYNGLEIVGKIRSDFTKNHIPIIVISIIGNEETIADAYRSGANDYIRKPIIANDLLVKIKKLFDNKGNQVLVTKKKL